MTEKCERCGMRCYSVSAIPASTQYSKVCLMCKRLLKTESERGRQHKRK